MADNKRKTGKHDDIRVNSKQDYEVEYLHKKYPKLSHQQISGAIRAAGPMRKNIKQYLKDKKNI